MSVLNPQNAIKNIRIEIGISQVELAQRLQVSPVTVSRWELGKSIPQSSMGKKLIAVARSLGVSQNCIRDLEHAVGGIKRAGVSGKKYGFPDVDQDLLYQVLDGSANAIYVIDVNTHKILYVNQRTAETAKNDYESALHMKCYEYMWNRHTPCESCPLKSLKQYSMTENVYYEIGKKHIRIRGRKIKWNGNDIYITYASDVTDIVEKEKRK